MKAQIVQIGNSQGIRIPKVLLEESGIRGEVELEICPDGILIRNVSKPRSDWDAKFNSMADQDDDHAASEIPISSQFEAKEWQW
jgi:antitoxin MazE